MKISPEIRSTGSLTEFARIANTSRKSAEKVMQAFPEAKESGKPNLEFARKLTQYPVSNFEFTDELILRPAINPKDMGGSIYLNDVVSLDHVKQQGLQALNARNNNITRWNRIATSRGYMQLEEKGWYFTGFWKCGDDIRDRLVQENGLIISTCGGFMHQACRVIAWIENIAFENRKVFLVEPLPPKESKAFEIRVKKPGQQTPDVFNA